MNEKEREVMKQALEALQGIYIAPEHDHYINVWWPACRDAIPALRAALAQEQVEPVQEPGSKMTAGRAIYFMERFKREEKMLGPNEQAALDFVISVLERHQSTPEPIETIKLIEECYTTLAEELAAWDIDPPLHHVKQAHDKCEAWLLAHQKP